MDLRQLSAHTALQEIGEDGQRVLSGATCAILGMGGLGCHVAQLLAASGVGRLTLVDPDMVDHTNLSRQNLYTLSDVGCGKVQVAQLKLFESYPHCAVQTESIKVEELSRLVCDVMVDCTDNRAARMALHHLAENQGTPLVTGSAIGWKGSVAVGPSRNLGSYLSTSSSENIDCSQVGVFTPVCSWAASVMAAETIKLILGLPGLGEDMAIANLLQADFRVIPVPQYSTEMAVPSISIEEFIKLKESNEPFVLLDVREPHEQKIAVLENSILIPMDQLPNRIEELEPNSKIVVYCRSGARSGQITEYLVGHGFIDVHNLVGGINQYAREIDPSLTIY